MRKKLFRFSLALLALAATAAAAPKRALAGGQCPDTVVYENIVCVNTGFMGDCHNCFYNCEGIPGVVGPFDECPE